MSMGIGSSIGLFSHMLSLKLYASAQLYTLNAGSHTEGSVGGGGGGGTLGFPPQKFENYDVIITSTATIGYTIQ